MILRFYVEFFKNVSTLFLKSGSTIKTPENTTTVRSTIYALSSTLNIEFHLRRIYGADLSKSVCDRPTINRTRWWSPGARVKQPNWKN